MPRGHGDKYSRLREAAVIALLAHPSIDAAAKSVGISEKCLRLWRAKSDFADAEQNARQQVLDAGVTRLSGLIEKAITTLEEGLKAKKAADRVRAARSIIEFRQRLDKDKIKERVEELERQLSDMRRGKTTINVHGSIGVTVSQDAFASFLEDA